MDRRLLIIPIFLLFAAVVMASGVMNTFMGGPEETPPVPKAPVPSVKEPEFVMQKGNTTNQNSTEPEEILEEAPAPAPMMSGGMGGASVPKPAPATPVPATAESICEGEDGYVVANFTAEVNCLNVTFTDTSENATSWEWDFGDGNVLAVLPIPYTYEEAGTYTVKLIAWDDDEQSDSKEMKVVVYDCSVSEEDEGPKCEIPIDQEIPEFPTIALPMLAIIGLAFFFNRKK
ncbi:PKD domain-containing protein [Methanolobus sp. ZRKC3]|uniref:PKD domain-containing protein n=1 Tax=Methanolobus sp. ZRKC3 TaxID=3125786 RepID=UPI00324E0CF6